VSALVKLPDEMVDEHVLEVGAGVPEVHEVPLPLLDSQPPRRPLSWQLHHYRLRYRLGDGLPSSGWPIGSSVNQMETYCMYSIFTQ
jgi:hypothetical protein